MDNSEYNPDYWAWRTHSANVKALQVIAKYWWTKILAYDSSYLCWKIYHIDGVYWAKYQANQQGSYDILLGATRDMAAMTLETHLSQILDVFTAPPRPMLLEGKLYIPK